MGRLCAARSFSGDAMTVIQRAIAEMFKDGASRLECAQHFNVPLMDVNAAIRAALRKADNADTD